MCVYNKMNLVKVYFVFSIYQIAFYFKIFPRIATTPNTRV